MRITDDAGWTLHRPSRRFRLGRGRALPGPLRSVSARRGTGSWLASFVVFGAAVVTIAVAVSGLADRTGPFGGQPTAGAAPRTRTAGTAPGAAVSVVPTRAETAPVVLQPVSLAEPPVAAMSQPADRPRAASASAGSKTAEASPFKLDLLPVLDAEGTGFDSEAPVTAPARPAARAGTRKPAAATTR